MTKLTFKELVKLEPILLTLLKQIKNEKPPTVFTECWEHRWYGRDGYKSRMCKLVGWDAANDNPLIKSRQAYDVAYRELCDSLPPCKICECTTCEDSPKFVQEY